MSNCLIFNKNQTLTKNVNDVKLIQEINQLVLSTTLVTIIIRTNDFVLVFENDIIENDVPIIENIVFIHKHLTDIEYIKIKIDAAIKFGQELITEYSAQNVLMGITQEGMTGVVRKRLEQVFLAISTGSLYDAILEIKAIPAENKDNKYITDIRLLNVVNRIETYLGAPLSTDL
jgi:hypothetical protein